MSIKNRKLGLYASEFRWIDELIDLRYGILLRRWAIKGLFIYNMSTRFRDRVMYNWKPSQGSVKSFKSESTQECDSQQSPNRTKRVKFVDLVKNEPLCIVHSYDQVELPDVQKSSGHSCVCVIF